jgi:hypothetical protein
VRARLGAVDTNGSLLAALCHVRNSDAGFRSMTTDCGRRSGRSFHTISCRASDLQMSSADALLHSG